MNGDNFYFIIIKVGTIYIGTSYVFIYNKLQYFIFILTKLNKQTKKKPSHFITEFSVDFLRSMNGSHKSRFPFIDPLLFVQGTFREKYKMSANDSDDEVALSADTLRALNEFLAEKKEKEEMLQSAMDNDEAVKKINIDEDWVSY